MHTKGPWTLAITEHDGHVHWEVRKGKRQIASNPLGGNGGSREIADARLIAAAPELLTACEATLHAVRCQCRKCPHYEDGRDGSCSCSGSQPCGNRDVRRALASAVNKAVRVTAAKNTML